MMLNLRAAASVVVIAMSAGGTRAAASIAAIMDALIAPAGMRPPRQVSVRGSVTLGRSAWRNDGQRIGHRFLLGR
jgi:hypothetical protein